MIDLEAKVSGNIDAGLDTFLGKITGSVLRSGTAAASNVIYNEVKLNTSGARAQKRDPKFVGPMPESPPGKVTGNLDDSIYQVYAYEDSTETVKYYRVSWNRSKAPHGHWLEFGNSRMAARPFIRPAADHMPAAIKAGLARIKEGMS